MSQARFSIVLRALRRALLPGSTLACAVAMLLASLAAQAQQVTSTAVATTSGAADLPSTSVALGAAYKLVGGGARTTYSGQGSLLTSLQPGQPGSNAWLAAAKDHLVADPATVTAVAVGLSDPGNQWDVGMFTATSVPAAAHPVATATLPAGYALTGGGCTDNWQTGPGAPGNLLTASFPSSKTTWECRGKDHGVAGPATITAYVIGIKPTQPGGLLPTVNITTALSPVGSHPEATAVAPPGAVLTGGGALAQPADPAGWGQLLTASVPSVPPGSSQPNGWYAASKDHSVASPGTVQAFAVSLSNFPPPPANAPVALPTWPQNFTIDSLSPTLFGFPVLSPGPVSVTVQSNGGPLVVSLIAPGGRVVAERQGVGAIALSYLATAADASAGVSWSVGIRSAVPGQPPIQVVATGSITVTYPPVDPIALQTALQAQVSQIQAQLAQRKLALDATPVVTLSMLSAQAQAKADQQLVQLQQSQLAALNSSNPPPASGSGSASSGAGSAGTPSFTLSAAQGTPGDSVDITGVNLGGAPGEVHMQIANGVDAIARIAFWTSTRIRFYVPTATALPVNDGSIRVVRSDGVASSNVPFRFLPKTRTLVVGIPRDSLGIVDSRFASDCSVTSMPHCEFFNNNPFAGFKGDDEFYLGTRMTNGWIVQGVPRIQSTNDPYSSAAIVGLGGVSVVDARPGTNSPYLKVHWWVGVLSNFYYWPVITIVGPQGLPCGIRFSDGSDVCLQP